VSFIDLSMSREKSRFCDEHDWRCCFIGGIAVQAWVTRDVGLTLLTGFGDEALFIETLLAHYSPRYSGVAEFALGFRVLLLKWSGGSQPRTLFLPLATVVKALV
jgi:hypothetical protein